MGVLVSIGSLYFAPTIEVQAQTGGKTITESRNHILLDVDQQIDLSQYTVIREAGNFTLAEATLTSVHPAVDITPVSISVTEKGIFTVSVSYQSYTMTLYVISKLSTESEFVIYQEDFSGMSGALPSQFTMLDAVGEPGGSAAIASNRLFLSGNTIVLFPSYLQGFTNYIIEADVNMTRVDNSSRWTSILFRYTKENYFQMAVRQTATATNGVEFAKRISGSWNVPATSSYKENLSASKSYRFKVDVFDTTVKEYIDNELLITYDSAYEFVYGRIGVQTNGSDVYFDNIKITLPASYVVEAGYEFKSVVNVYQPQTGIVAPATSIVWAESKNHVETLIGEVRPATVIFRVNQNLDIIDHQGHYMMPLEDALILIDGKVIPAFYTNDEATAASLAETLRQLRIFDLFIVSKDKDTILGARANHNLMRGIYYVEDVSDDLTIEDLMNIRRSTNQAQAVAVLLPGEKMNQRLVHEMQKRAMTVWVTAANDPVSQYRAVLSGANGIQTQDYQALFAIYETFGPNTHVRRPLFIAHRGLFFGGSEAPENTIEAAMIAFERGADIIELDVHFSLDLEVVVIHDSGTQRTAPDVPNKVVSQTTLEQLKEINLFDPIEGRENVKIPTLREFMQAFKGLDVVLFIEPKPTQPLLMQFIMEIIEELDMYDQSAIIAFSPTNIEAMNQAYPEISNGLLTGGLLNAQNVEASLTNTFSNVVTINSTLNPHFGALRPEFIYALTHRGVGVYPWTINELPSLIQYYNYGVGAITTDFFSHFDETFNRLVFEQYKYQYIFGESELINLRGAIQTQNGTSYPYMPEMIVIDEGGTGITFDINGRMQTITHPGAFYGYTVFTSNLPDGSSIIITSDLFEIIASYPEPEPSDPTDEVPVDPGDQTPQKTGCFGLWNATPIYQLQSLFIPVISILTLMGIAIIKKRF
jgi:glycerophosphoryl diester phosphodiesterase